MNELPTEDPTLTPDPATSYRLFQYGVVALIIGIAWLGYKSPTSDQLLTATGGLMMIVAAWPALNWARKGLAHFPMFEIFMLTCVPFYAVPLLAGHPDVLQFSDAATRTSALAILLFEICAVGTFAVTHARPLRSPRLTKSLLPARAHTYAMVGLIVQTIYLFVNSFTSWIPRDIALPLRATCTGVGMVALFLLARRWGGRQLGNDQKAGIVLNVFLQLILQFRELYLISGISTILLAFIGYVSTSRRLPVIPLIVMLPIVAVLHNGKATMRVKYWEEQKPIPGLLDLGAYFSEWFQAGLTVQPKTEANENTTLAGRLFERASLFQMLCLVVDRTPQGAPFLEGESYKYLPAQLVPSVFWPNKPSSLESNVLLAIHYGLVSPDDPKSVSIAFGMIAEAYANFGMFGCGLLGVVLGYGYKRVSLASIGLPQFSAVGLLTVLLTAWSFQIEQIFASWVVSLLQAAVVVIGIPLAIRIVFNPE